MILPMPIFSTGASNTRAGIFHGVVENRCNFAANAHATHLLVRDTCYWLAEIPQDAVSGGLSGRACAYDVAYKRDR